MKKRMLIRCIVAILICGWLASCNKGMGEYVYIDGNSALHTDKNCKCIAVLRKSSPVSMHKTNSIIAGEWSYICPKCVRDKDYKAIERIGERNLKGYNVKRELYYSLSRKYDMGTLDKFLVDIEDKEKRRLLYEEIKDEYKFTSFAAFSLYLKGHNIDPTKVGEEFDEEYDIDPYEYSYDDRDNEMRFGRTGH